MIPVLFSRKFHKFDKFHYFQTQINKMFSFCVSVHSVFGEADSRG